MAAKKQVVQVTVSVPDGAPPVSVTTMQGPNREFVGIQAMKAGEIKDIALDNPRQYLVIDLA